MLVSYIMGPKPMVLSPIIKSVIINETSDAFVIDKVFGAVDEVVSKSGAFKISAVILVEILLVYHHSDKVPVLVSLKCRQNFILCKINLGIL